MIQLFCLVYKVDGVCHKKAADHTSGFEAHIVIGKDARRKLLRHFLADKTEATENSQIKTVKNQP
jgi:hypothetical protein